MTHEIPVIYIASSPFSGSTLLAFLLNNHPEVTTAGHTTGWSGLTPMFPCSCGASVSDCPFFNAIERAFEAEGLSFGYEGHFPTRYAISSHERLNQLVFDNLPRIGTSRLEYMRDWFVQQLPAIRRRIEGVDRANRIFMRAALAYAGARLYVDNSHSPYRCRRLARAGGFQVYPVHLVKDPRGVVLSATEAYGWSVGYAATHWMRVQAQIVRVLQGTQSGASPGSGYRDLVLSYEALCDRPVEATKPVLSAAGLSPLPLTEDFKAGEHHILGNQMRLGSGRISKSERWQRDLKTAEQAEIKDRCWTYAAASPWRRELEALLEVSLA